jgi:hypothetical protein
LARDCPIKPTMAPIKRPIGTTYCNRAAPT